MVTIILHLKKLNSIFEDDSENPIQTSEEFPYIFNTGRGTVGQWHTQARTREIAESEKIYSKEAYAFMHTRISSRIEYSSK